MSTVRKQCLVLVCIIDQVWLVGIVNEGQEAIKTHR